MPTMPDIKIRVHTQGGESHSIQTPADMKSADFLTELVGELSLPTQDAEGHQVSWVLDDKNTGKTLTDERTLGENGVKEGHDLHLRREVVAGADQAALGA
jgi:WXG100 protein secretion system (Wss), protein YukD